MLMDHRALWQSWASENMALLPGPPKQVRPVIAIRWIKVSETSPPNWSDWKIAGALLGSTPDWLLGMVSVPDADCIREHIEQAVRDGFAWGTKECHDTRLFFQWRLI